MGMLKVERVGGDIEVVHEEVGSVDTEGGV